MEPNVTIKFPVQAGFTEKKSEFTARAAPVSDETEAYRFIKEIRAANRKAAHNCYAYVLLTNNALSGKNSDDGEPAGTAGVPIYEILRKNRLVNTVCVVTRYYGGIKLGAGGLIRAYSKAASLAATAAEKIVIRATEKITLSFGYGYYNAAAAVIAQYGAVALTETFAEKITVKTQCPAENADELKKSLIQVTKNNILITD